MDFPVERVTPVATAAVPIPPRRVVRSPEGDIVLVSAEDGRFVVLDRSLRLVRQGAVLLGGPAAITDAGDLAVASPDRLVVFDTSGRRTFELPHAAMLTEGRKPVALGDVFALPSGEILAGIPSGPEHFKVLLVTEAGRVKARAAVPVPADCGLFFLDTPKRGMVGLWAAAGPECWSFLIHVESNALRIVPIAGLQDNDHGPMTFRSDGREVLVQTVRALLRFEWDGDAFRKVAAIPAPDDELGFAETPAYFGDGRCLVTDVGSARLFVVTLDGSRPLHELVIAGHEPMTFQELFPQTRSDEDSIVTDLFYLRPWSNGRVLTVHQRHGTQTLNLLAP